MWRQKAQYLQHKQNKAEATTIKHKTANDGKSKGIFVFPGGLRTSFLTFAFSSHCGLLNCFVLTVVGTAAGVVSPTRTPGTISLSPARVPDVDPIDAAAHLQLLGESLSLIGHRLQETEVSVCS